MSTMSFNDQAVKKLLNAKLVKPSSAFYNIQPYDGGMSISSIDTRRMIKLSVLCDSVDGVVDNKSEYFIPIKKLNLFSYPGSYRLKFNEDHILVNIKSDVGKKSAKIRRKNMRQYMFDNFKIFDEVEPVSIDSDVLRTILKNLSASAQIKETKTDADMKKNKIQFYGQASVAISDATYYGTFCYHDDIKFDISISSADVPIVMGFCDISEGPIEMYDAKTHFMCKNSNEDTLLITKVVTERSELFEIEDEYEHVIEIDLAMLKDAVKWAIESIDGTQRVKFKFDGNVIEMLSSGSMISSLYTMTDSKPFDVDLPIQIVSNIIHNIKGKTIKFKYKNKSTPTIVEINGDKDDEVQTRYFISAMLQR